MTNPVFGLSFVRVEDQPQPVVGANLDVVGIIGPCSTADAATFPLNTPVLVFTNDSAKIAKLSRNGVYDGYIADAINAIGNQLTDFQIAAQVVIVRTEYGESGDTEIKLQQTIANIMGSYVAKTGVHAFRDAPNTLFCTPRLICAPGYTGQMATSLDTLVIDDKGVGYQPGVSYAVTFAAGSGETNEAQLVLPTAHAVANVDGEINDADIVIDSYGAWLTVPPTAILPEPDGTNLDAVKATGEIIFTVNPSVGNTVTLNGSVTTFIANGAVESGNTVALGEDLIGTLDALVIHLNDSGDSEILKCTYTSSSTNLIISNDTAGVAGNEFTVATNVSGTSAMPHLTGGRDVLTPVTGTLVTTIADGANPVCAELGGVLDALIAHAVVESAGSSYGMDLRWRSAHNHPRLIGLSGGVKVLDTSGVIKVMPFAPRMIGQMIARDFATGYPFHSAANQAIQGIVGPARTISFSLTDGATEGQQLLAANLGILVRGLIGVETAVSSGGFVLISTDNMGDNELWRFYNVMRGRDYIHLSMMPALRTYLGRSNIDRQTIANVIATMNGFLSTLQALQQIIGYTTRFQGGLNSASEIRQGRITVSFSAEEPPVLRRITTMSARYKPAIDALVNQLEQQLSLVA